MIAHLNGTITQIREDRAVVECGGVGYQVLLAPATVATLPGIGRTMRLPTWLSVREDAMVLYGFGSEDEKQLFEELLAVNGVGPKVAQNVVAAMPVAHLVDAIANGDEARLVSVPGVGRKLAQRIVVELSDQVGKRGWVQQETEGGALTGDLVEALTGLGFSAQEARRAARGALSQLGDQATLELALREALRRVNEA